MVKNQEKKCVCYYCGNILKHPENKKIYIEDEHFNKIKDEHGNPILESVCTSCLESKIKEESNAARKKIEEKIKDGTITHMPAKYNVLVNFRIEVLANLNKTIDENIEKIHEYIGGMIRPLDIDEDYDILQIFNYDGEIVYDALKDIDGEIVYDPLKDIKD